MTSAPDGPAEDTARPVPDTPEHREFVIRRAPKVQVFLLGGAVLGALAALLVTLLGPAHAEFTPRSVFGFFLVVFGVIGVGVGGLLWLALDRRSRKKAYTVHAETVRDPAQADYALGSADLQQWRERWEDERRGNDAR